MHTITVNINNHNLFEKIIWLLERFKNDGLEIIAKEDINDLKMLKATRNDDSIQFEEYLINEN